MWQKVWCDCFVFGVLIWLIEIGGVVCGGFCWQLMFFDIFCYFDMQVCLVKFGFDVIFIYVLISGSNGVIDEKMFELNVSYWGVVLWCCLMGIKVFDVGLIQFGLYIYVYCLCGMCGGVVLFVLNLESVFVDLCLDFLVQFYLFGVMDLQS